MDVCSIDGCDRKVWFTAEQVCRRHGLAVGLGVPVEPESVLSEDDPLWQPDPDVTGTSATSPVSRRRRTNL